MQQAAQEEHAVVEQLVAVQTASLEEQSCSKKVVSIQSPAQDVQLSTGRAVSLQQPAQEEQACGVGGAIPLQQAPQQTGQAVARAQVSARGCTATEDTKTETASASTVAKTPMPTPDVPNREHRTASQASTAGGQQSARGDTATMRAKPDEAPVAPASDVQARVQHTSSQAGRIAMQSLVFVCAQGDKLERQSLEEGLRLLAEGYKGIITGPVLDILVQHAAPAVLDLVLRSTAVCAQMRSEHKKQLVELMSSQGATLPGKQHIKVCPPAHTTTRTCSTVDCLAHVQLHPELNSFFVCCAHGLLVSLSNRTLQISVG